MCWLLSYSTMRFLFNCYRVGALADVLTSWNISEPQKFSSGIPEQIMFDFTMLFVTEFIATKPINWSYFGWFPAEVCMFATRADRRTGSNMHSGNFVCSLGAWGYQMSRWQQPHAPWTSRMLAPIMAPMEDNSRCTSRVEASRPALQERSQNMTN